MVYSLCFLGMILLCQSHHVRLLHPVRFAGTSPPSSLQTPGISLSRACPLIKPLALPFFSITYELPNLQALCFDIHTTCRGCGGPAPVLASQQRCFFHLCESVCSRRLCVISFRSLPPATSHESRSCPELRGATAFKLFGSAEFFSISVAAHEQKSALLY